MKTNNLVALDCTLRDGSYRVNYNFSPILTNTYLKKIEKLGFKYCEIGHGLGFGAQKHKLFKSKFPDKLFIDLVNSTNIKTKIGFFAQPKFLNNNDLNEISNSKIDFVRIGVTGHNIKDLDKPVNFLLKKKKEIFVFFMQSANISADSLKKKIKSIYANFGVKNFYIADSTGSMHLNDIKSYAKSLQSLGLPLKLGFHGHDNLGNANSNTSACIQEGFAFFDGTLMGEGRGAGNACLEHLIINHTKKLRFKKNKIIDLLKLSSFFMKKTNLISSKNYLHTLCGIMKIHEKSKEFKRVKKIIS